MQINYDMMCIVSPRENHITFLKRKPYPSLNTYYIPIPIQVRRFKSQVKKTSRGRSFVELALFVNTIFSYKHYSDLHSQFRINRRWLWLTLQLIALVLLLESNTALVLLLESNTAVIEVNGITRVILL